MTKITSILFKNRKNIQWNEVKEYMKRFQGSSYIILEYGDVISINLTSIDEYTSSNYTRRLKGTLAKSKANAV